MKRRSISSGHKYVEALDLALRSCGLSAVREHVFHPTRKWRFDLAVPDLFLALEYHGHAGFYGKSDSGHSTIKGLTNDCEKINQARILGWTVFSFTALHFRETDRLAHKLTSPVMTLEAWMRNNPFHRPPRSKNGPLPDPHWWQEFISINPLYAGKHLAELTLRDQEAAKDWAFSHAGEPGAISTPQ